jgi:hypothetical protein
VAGINAGSETNEQLIVWQRFQDKILIKIKSLAQLPMTQLVFRLNP